jgi:hypothetical protein
MTLAVPAAAFVAEGTGEPRRVQLPLADAAAWPTGRDERPDLPALPRRLSRPQESA